MDFVSNINIAKKKVIMFNYFERLEIVLNSSNFYIAIFNRIKSYIRFLQIDTNDKYNETNKTDFRCVSLIREFVEYIDNIVIAIIF